MDLYASNDEEQPVVSSYIYYDDTMVISHRYTKGVVGRKSDEVDPKKKDR